MRIQTWFTLQTKRSPLVVRYTGSTTLKAGLTKVLINAQVGIKAQPGWLIVIAGQTDANGVVEQNLALSHACASAVRDWTQQMCDIGDSCFAVQGFAANQPIASNATEAGRTANRRVDIQRVPQVGACEQTALAEEAGRSQRAGASVHLQGEFRSFHGAIVLGYSPTVAGARCPDLPLARASPVADGVVLLVNCD
ncbi:Outer membrane protein [Pseudomonas orientalis]|nr:Outer membrane protein [Pseudomonas orientalis]